MPDAKQDPEPQPGSLTPVGLLKSYFILLVAPALLLGALLVQGKVIFWGTPALQFVPWWQFGLDSLRQGVLPLWNPLNGMGAPLIANYQSAFFYPPDWLLLVFGLLGGQQYSAASIAVGYMLLSILHLAWAGVGMALLLRKMGFGWLSQVIAGLSFGLSGYVIGRLGFFSMVWVAAWLTWVMLCVERIAKGFSAGVINRSRLPDWMLLGLCFAMQLLAGHAQLTTYSIMLAGVWLLVSAWRSRKEIALWRPVLKFSLALFYAAAIAAVQLAPTFEYLRQSQRADAVDLDVALTYSFWPWRLLTIFAPDFFGNPSAGDFWGYASYWEDHLYFGMIPMLLAMTSLILLLRDSFRKPKPPHYFLSVFLWAGVMVTFIIAMGRFTPVFPFLYHAIPGFDMFQAPARYLIWAAFALPILAAVAVERWRSPTGRGLYWFRLATAGAFAVTLGAGIAWISAQGIQPSFIRAAALAGLWALGFGLLTLVIPLARKRKKSGLWQWAVIAWVLVDLLVASYALNPGTSLAFYQKKPAQIPIRENERIYLSRQTEYDLKFTRFLRFDDFRPLEDWSGLREVVLPNTNLFQGLSLVSNFDPLIPEGYARWMKAIENSPPAARNSWLRWAGVGVVEQVDLREPTGVRFDRLAGASRFRWSNCAKAFGDTSAVWQTLETEMLLPYNPQRDILIENTGGKNVQAFDGNCSDPSLAEIQLMEERSDKLVFEIDAPSSGWLEIMDTWYPGWSASIDGEETPIYRADGSFRAVAVPPGAHEIVIHYRPSGFIFGGLFSILVLLLTMVWWIFIGRRTGFSSPIQ